MASADHLYVKAAAAAWLHCPGSPEEQAQFDFVRPDGAEIGSVLDIRFKARGLRVHLDQAVEPVWDEEGREPVLGVSVPVDRETLIDRWHIHWIRLNSIGVLSGLEGSMADRTASAQCGELRRGGPVG
ncbi:hypothetical protein [Streptomyces sp. NPDC058401]|uniref:hypothetical protein n=1 Tax=Streptomyces sp. NPDC058401 TaxID=3346480 RepID=UPI00364D99B6